MIKNRRVFIIPVGKLSAEDAKASLSRLMKLYNQEFDFDKINKIEKIINSISYKLDKYKQNF